MAPDLEMRLSFPKRSSPKIDDRNDRIYDETAEENSFNDKIKSKQSQNYSVHLHAKDDKSVSSSRRRSPKDKSDTFKEQFLNGKQMKNSRADLGMTFCL